MAAALVFNIEEIRLLPKGRGLKLIDAAPGKTALEEILPVDRWRCRQAQGRTPGKLPRQSRRQGQADEGQPEVGFFAV